MTHQRLLLLSNSKTEGLGYLDHAEAVLRDFLGDQVQTVVFVPFAGVRISYAEYTRLVRDRFGQMGYQIVSLHEVGDPIQAVTEAQAIAVGGGNTFYLLQSL
ncbi:MAG TPA: Type 1 glutamine amidotransferase-like domain-containing protein, partial [Acidobacteriota bacterium]|nr:Type 1 glutamine amidotransferase-like domain-containing protein [Acidobacteriota bacterium]